MCNSVGIIVFSNLSLYFRSKFRCYLCMSICICLILCDYLCVPYFVFLIVSTYMFFLVYPEFLSKCVYLCWVYFASNFVSN